MTTREFQRFCESLFQGTKRITPIDTGNMRYNAVKMVYTDGGNECHIYVDEAIAPYVFYTNEPWISPKWHGKKNPNEGWWDNAAQIIDERIRQRLGAKLSQNNIIANKR